MGRVIIAAGFLTAAGIAVWALSGQPSDRSPQVDAPQATQRAAADRDAMASAGPDTARFDEPEVTRGLRIDEAVGESDDDLSGESVGPSDALAGLSAQQQVNYQQMRRQLRPDRVSEERCTRWMTRLADLAGALETASESGLKVLEARTNCLVELGRPADAEALVAKAAGQNPDSVAIQVIRADMLAEQGDFEGALIALRAAQELGGSDKTRQMLATIQWLRATDSRFRGTDAQNMRRLQEGEAALRELIDTADHELPRVVSQFQLAQNLTTQRRFGEAVAAAERALATYQDLAVREGRQRPGLHADVLFQLGRAHYAAGSRDVGLAYIEQALKLPVSGGHRERMRRGRDSLDEFVRIIGGT